MILQKIHKVTYPISILIVVLLLLSANRVKMPYTPYQILIWEIKANEGYRSTWYRDGWVNGKAAYSIGFGWNDQGQRRRHEIKKYLSDGKVDFNEATEITIKELNKYGQLHRNKYKNLALQLYSYNCGLTRDGSKLGRCCHGRWGCGNMNSNIRKSHNRRRKVELALWNMDVAEIIKFTEQNQQKIGRVMSALKSRGEL